MPPRSKKRKRDEPQQPIDGDQALDQVRDEAPESRLVERMPRQSLEAEQATLGAMLVEREAILRVLASELEPRDFYGPQHATIAEVIFAVFKRDEPVDIVMVDEELRRRDMLERVGGTQYLVDLQEAAPSAAAVGHYAKIVRRHSIARTQSLAAESYAAMLRREGEEDDHGLHHSALVRALELGSVNGQEIITAEALLRMDLKREYLVEPMIPLGGLTIFAGEGGIGKSWLGLSVAHAAVNKGQKWLGHFSMRHGNALYLDYENPRIDQQLRLKAFDMAAAIATPQSAVPELVVIDPWAEDEEPAPKIEYPPGLFWWFEPDLSYTRAGRLEGIIRDLNLRLVIIDSWVNYAPGVKGNDDWAVSQTLLPLIKLTRKIPWCAILLLHHFTKPKVGEGSDVGNLPQHRVKGSSAFRDRVDACYTYSGTPGGARVLASAKFRPTFSQDLVLLKPEPTFLVEIKPGEHGGYSLVHAGDVKRAEEGIQNALEALIPEMLVERPMMRSALKEACQARLGVEGATFDDKTLTRALMELKAQGVVEGKKVAGGSRYRMVGGEQGLWEDE